MKRTKVEDGTEWENDTAIPQGVYSGTQLVTLQPGEHLFVPDAPAPANDDAAPVAAAMVHENGD